MSINNESQSLTGAAVPLAPDCTASVRIHAPSAGGLNLIITEAHGSSDFCFSDIGMFIYHDGLN